MNAPRLNALRITILFFIFCALYGIIFITLFTVQITQHTFYKNLAHNQYHITLTQRPPRASIIDRTATQYLAMNKDTVSAFLLPKAIKDHEKLNTFLHHNFPDACTRLQLNKTKKFLYIKRSLNDQEQSLIKESDCQDIYLIKEPNRFYPLPSAACIVGITNKENIGLLGLEKTYNTQLAGTPTTVSLERDARSGIFYFKKNTTTIGCDGTPLQLTLESDLQFLAQRELDTTIKELDAKEGAALIMDPETGDILAMVNAPCFDPYNTYNLSMNETKVRCITEQYELGSVFKVFAALAALQEGVVTPDELIDCHNTKTAYVDGRKVNTVVPCGIIPFTDVIARSNNIGIAKVAKRLNETLYDHYIKMGFGTKTGLDLPGEQAGFVNHPSNWSKQSIISLSYGYEVTATLLQVAKAFAMIARDGTHITPRILISTPIQTETEYIYKPETIQTLKEILRQTTQRGTARRAHIKGYDVMSKTSTANILENGVYNEHKQRYTCAGIVQKGSYKRIIVTFIQEANRPRLYASTVVAPLFERIAERMLIHERII